MFGNGKILSKLNKIDTCTALVKMDLGHVKKDFKEHKDNDNEWKKEDKIWQAKLLQNSLECVKGKQIDNMQDDVDTLKTDKVTRDGKILGIKSVYAVILGAVVLIGGVLGILWRLGYL